MPAAAQTEPASAPALDDAKAQAIVARAIERYIGQRRARIGAFVDANFSLLGALRLHRRALGLDLLRAPANVALVPPYLIAQLGAAGLGRLGARKAARWLRRRQPFLATDVARELTFRLHRDLLELPYDDGVRRTERDALAAAILEDERLAAPLAQIEEQLARRRGEPAAEARLRAMLETYAGAHTAAADLLNNALLASGGAALFQSSRPALHPRPGARGRARRSGRVARLPLGAGLGSLWYAWTPTAPSAALLAGTTGALILLTALTAGFAGRPDPLQRALRLHGAASSG